MVEALEKEADAGRPTLTYSPELLHPDLGGIPSFPSFAGPAALAYPKGSELRPLFDHHLLRILQSGAFDRIHYKWLGSYREMYGGNGDGSADESGVSPIPIEQLSLPALIIAVGVASAAIVAVVERFTLARSRPVSFEFET